MTGKEREMLDKMLRFGTETARLRAEFPEFAREIDRAVYDAGKNKLGFCGATNCDCQMSFEDFHRQRNRLFGSGKGLGLVS